MSHILKNQNLEIVIDLPFENYQKARFDWTGKIVEVIYKGKSISGREIAHIEEDPYCGKGFYNEFGITTPLGYDEIETGDWFHKIGIGLLKKEKGPYDFLKRYDVKPATFEVSTKAKSLQMTCHSPSENGYAYRLEKEISLKEDGFEIAYSLENKGGKPIITNEYNHNFISFDSNLVGKNYVLSFSFNMDPKNFGEYVNPEGFIEFNQNEIRFLGNPTKPFFFSNLSGGQWVDATWKLEYRKSKIGITESCNFQTNAINLWGWGHVISPELFIPIHIPPGQSMDWSRNYRLYEIN